MTLNIDTNNNEQMKTLNEILAKYEQLEECTKKLHFVTIKELAEMMRLFTKHSKSNF